MDTSSMEPRERLTYEMPLFWHSGSLKQFQIETPTKEISSYQKHKNGTTSYSLLDFGMEKKMSVVI